MSRKQVVHFSFCVSVWWKIIMSTENFWTGNILCRIGRNDFQTMYGLIICCTEGVFQSLKYIDCAIATDHLWLENIQAGWIVHKRQQSNKIRCFGAVTSTFLCEHPFAALLFLKYRTPSLPFSQVLFRYTGWPRNHLAKNCIFPLYFDRKSLFYLWQYHRVLSLYSSTKSLRTVLLTMIIYWEEKNSHFLSQINNRYWVSVIWYKFFVFWIFLIFLIIYLQSDF